MKISIILPLCNEEEKIRDIILELRKLQPFEIIAVVNGSTDRTKLIVEELGCIVYEYKQALGHNVGRAIGAYYATGDILLFLDGDIVVRAEEILPFVKAIEGGYDIALNQLHEYWDVPYMPHLVSVAKKVINNVYHKGKLSINSLVAIPHAMSKNAVSKIKWWNLTFPPLAQAIAMEKKLKITSPKAVDVVSTNKIRDKQHRTLATNSPYTVSSSRILGDHIYALHALLEKEGVRGGKMDDRVRDFQLPKKLFNESIKKSAVIANSQTLPRLDLIQQLQQAGVEEITVVTGELEGHESESLALKNAGVRIIPISYHLGTFVNRSIGASFSTGKNVIFLDGTEQLSHQTINKYFNELDAGAGVVLSKNDVSMRKGLSDQNTYTYFINLMCKKPELKCNSILTTPFATNHNLLQKLGVENLMVPLLAQVIMMTKGVTVKVIPYEGNMEKISNELLIGDLLEAVSTYVNHTNERGGFPLGNRKLQVIDDIKKKTLVAGKKVSIILPLMNEEETIEKVIHELKKLHPLEIITVVNGSSDNTATIVRDHNCKVIEYGHSLGFDVGRAIGAYYAKGDILLFLDGDIMIKHWKLKGFIREIINGADIAVNDLSWTLLRKINPHPTTLGKKAINDLCKRSDLSLNSIVAIPHAISRKALKEIGWWNLADPPLAMVKAIKKNLVITTPGSVDVIYANKKRSLHQVKENKGTYSFTVSSNIGVHLKALNEVLLKRNIRGGYDDFRDRFFVENYETDMRIKKVQRSAVICEEVSLSYMARQIKILRDLADEIIIVTNEKEKGNKVVKDDSIKYVFLERPRGPFTTRAIGAKHAQGNVILFIDSKTKLTKEDIIQYFEEAEKNKGIALNNNHVLLDTIYPIDAINTIQTFLNFALHTPKLANGSFLPLPHAIHKTALKKIGTDSLMIPPLALTKAIVDGLPISTNCSTPNGLSFYNALVSVTDEKYKEDIYDIVLGDYLEAFSYLLMKKGELGGFLDGNKDRKALEELKNNRANNT